MLINNFKKVTFFLSLSLILGIVNIPQTLATELKYTTIVSNKDDQILFRSGGLEKTSIFICQINTLSCENIGSTTPPVVSESFTNNDQQDEKIKNVKFDRKNATRILLSPDEKWLTYYDASLANKENSRKFVLIALENGEKIRTYELPGKVNYWDLLSEELRIFNFSPSGKKLLYLDDRTGFSTLYSVDLTGQPPKGGRLPGKQVILKKYSVADFLFWDDEVIYFSANREGAHLWSLYRYNLTTKDLKKVADNVSYNQKMRKVGKEGQEKLLFMQVINNSSIPALLNPTPSTGSGQEIYKISRFPELLANPKITAYTEKEVTLDSGASKLGGVLLKPSNYSTANPPAGGYPLIIWLHGGPYRQTALGYHSYLGYAVYDWMLGELAKNGALVLKLDYRGSYGYGRTFAESITGEVGKGDVTDVLNAQAELKKYHKISNTYLAGNSYGGYLALRTVVDPQATGKIAGVLSINGVTDWFALLEKLENSIFNVQFKGLLEEDNSALYYQASIIERIKNLKNQKIVVAQAENDRTVPESQADYLAKVFSVKNKQLSLVKYAGEDHVFKKKSSLEDLCRQLASLSGTKARCNWE